MIAEETVFIGQRGGTFFALRLADGKLKWKFTPGTPILNGAAYDAGQVFFCDEKIIMHCLEQNCQYTGIYDLEKKVCYDLPGCLERKFTLCDATESGNNAASIADGRFYHIIYHDLWAWTSAEGGRK